MAPLQAGDAVPGPRATNGVPHSRNHVVVARATAIMSASPSRRDPWSAMACHTCEKTEEDTRLSRCSVCHRAFCEEHRHVMSGRSFCSQRCAEYFFFADPEDD